MPASDVGYRLREARKAAGLTLREITVNTLASRTIRTIDNIERGQRASVDQIEKAWRALWASLRAGWLWDNP